MYCLFNIKFEPCDILRWYVNVPDTSLVIVMSCIVPWSHVIQDELFQMQPNNSHVLSYGTRMKSEAGPPP
jgi:hypothetical protein